MGLVLTAAAGLLAGASTFLAGQDLHLGVRKENLDLPFDAARKVVTFYGQNLEGDGFFYAVDRSGSMQDSGELQRAKQEVSRNVSEFSDDTQFGIVFLDARVVKFPSSGRPAEANPASKSAALSFVSSMSGGGGSCMTAGLREALQYANLSSARRKIVVYVGDGGGTCSASGQGEETYLENMLTTITSQNYQRARINCIGVLMRGSREMQKQYMRRLAAANGGTYREIN